MRRHTIMLIRLLAFHCLLPLASVVSAQENIQQPINRKALVTRYSPTRYTSFSSSPSANDNPTPYQIGNGNFAFNTDITSLQSFHTFNTLSSWGFKTDAYPTGRSRADIDDYKGVSWLVNRGYQSTDGGESLERLVQYDFGGPPDIEAWLRGNPNRANLGRIGLVFFDGTPRERVGVVEGDVVNATQRLDLWTGTLTSTFTLFDEAVKVTSATDLESDTLAVTVESKLVEEGRLGLFVDYPWNEGTEKFQAPFVGYWDRPERYSTQLTWIAAATGEATSTANFDSEEDTGAEDDGKRVGVPQLARISHTMDSTRFNTYISAPPQLPISISRDTPGRHRYTILPSKRVTPLLSPPSPARTKKVPRLSVSFQFTPESAPRSSISLPAQVEEGAKKGWGAYWLESGFVDVFTDSSDPRADELQRRIVLSRYLMRVNGAGDTPSQESGLVNNGWFGKFHMEMYFWHHAHWALWGNSDLLSRSSSIYSSCLPSSISRAQKQQGYGKGARWPKMTDPSGRSSPGELNNLLIWQQPHPIILALYEYRASPTRSVLLKWRDVVKATADWMAEFAVLNQTSGKYDLAAPIHVVSEDTPANSTLNPAFELAYWKFGLEEAEKWVNRLREQIPEKWVQVRQGLAELPLDAERGLYQIYEGVAADFWTDVQYTSDHPALVGLHGWLPPTRGLDLAVARRTAEEVWQRWNITNCWGWDFPMLAMSAARNGNPERALEWLLHPLFAFDDAGMPIGGERVPTPYFPSSGSLLYAVAMMAEGWDGAENDSPGFPKSGWQVRSEGMIRAL